MTNFNRRTLMSLAGIAAAGPAMSLLGSAETRKSALPEVQTGNGEWIVGERIGCPVYLIEFEINGRATIFAQTADPPPDAIDTPNEFGK